MTSCCVFTGAAARHRTRLSLDMPRELQPATCPALQPSQIETAECASHRPGFRQLLSSPGSRVAQVKIRTDVAAFRRGKHDARRESTGIHDVRDAIPAVRHELARIA